jgi:copper(I)-binding protein
MMKPFCCFLVLLASFMVAPAMAADPVRVERGWTRATLPGQKVAGAYFEILSPRQGRLLGVTVVGAGSAELHSMKLDNGTMRMRALDSVELPAGKWVKLKPNGMHVMLFGLDKPLQARQTLPMQLTIQLAGEPARQVNATLEVRENEASGAHGHH